MLDRHHSSSFRTVLPVQNLVANTFFSFIHQTLTQQTSTFLHSILKNATGWIAVRASETTLAIARTYSSRIYICISTRAIALSTLAVRESEVGEHLREFDEVYPRDFARSTSPAFTGRFSDSARRIALHYTFRGVYIHTRRYTFYIARWRCRAVRDAHEPLRESRASILNEDFYGTIFTI